MKTAREIVTISICIQIGAFLVLAMNLPNAGTWLSHAVVNWDAWSIILIGAIVGSVALIIGGALLAGGSALTVTAPIKLEVAASMAAIILIYGITTAATALFLGAIPWIGGLIGSIYALISAVAIVWDISDRGTGTKDRLGD